MRREPTRCPAPCTSCSPQRRRPQTRCRRFATPPGSACRHRRGAVHVRHLHLGAGHHPAQFRRTLHAHHPNHERRPHGIRTQLPGSERSVWSTCWICPGISGCQVRFFLSWRYKKCASFESFQDAHSVSSTLFDSTAMKLLPTFAPLILARLRQALRSLQASLRGWAPRPAPVLVPIPLQADHSPHHAVEHRHRRGL